MIKVMMVIPTLSIAGAERVVTDLALNIDKTVFDVEIVVLFASTDTAYEKILKKNNIKITFLNKKIGFDVSVMFKLRKLIKDKSPDVIHAHLNTLLYLSVIPRQYIGKIIYTVHNLAEYEAYGLHLKYQKYIFKKVKFVAISDKVNESINRVYGNYGILINNGIDTSRYVCNSRNYDKCNKLVAVGRLSEQKNYNLMLDAFRIVMETYPDIKLEIYGEGELKSVLSDKIVELNLSQNVELKGLTDNVPEVFSQSDIFVMSSEYEGFGLVIAEALASGLPVVSTYNGGAENIIDDYTDGLLVGNKKEELATAISELFNSKELRTKLGKNALLKARKFDILYMVNKYQNLYTEMYELQNK